MASEQGVGGGGDFLIVTSADSGGLCYKVHLVYDNRLASKLGKMDYCEYLFYLNYHTRT